MRATGSGRDTGDGAGGDRTADADPVDALAAAAERRDRLAERVASVGESAVERVAEAHRGAAELMERYEDRATDWDDFEGYVEFQDAFVDYVEGLPEDLPERESFEAADDIFEASRLTEDHFERARAALAPARELAELREDLAAARERYAEARRAVERRRRELADRDGDLLRVLALGNADLSAPTERLREPIEAYDRAVRAAFASFRREESARDVFDVLEAAAAYPLVDLEAPPDRLADYVRSAEVGTEPIPTLLEYADYSASKRDHYVTEPREFQRHVATNRTYLDRLSADALTVGWPPPPASLLAWRTREYLRIVARFAPEETVAKLRTVRSLTDDREAYGRLREAACARAELTERERERLAAGEVESELERVREERERLAAALSEFPPGER